MAQAETDEKMRLADLRFRLRYNLAFGLLMLAIGIAFVADYLNASYGNGWDPLEMRQLQNNAASQFVVVILLVVAFVLGFWKTFIAIAAHRELVSQQ